jgi:hypothetical protein
MAGIDTPHTWVEWSRSQLLQNTPLHPIAEWGRQRFGGADVRAERRLAELESSLAQVKLDPAENASLLAPLFDIPLLQAHDRLGPLRRPSPSWSAPPVAGAAIPRAPRRHAAQCKFSNASRSDHARRVARHPKVKLFTFAKAA